MESATSKLDADNASGSKEDDEDEFEITGLSDKVENMKLSDSKEAPKEDKKNNSLKLTSKVFKPNTKLKASSRAFVPKSKPTETKKVDENYSSYPPQQNMQPYVDNSMQNSQYGGGFGQNAPNYYDQSDEPEDPFLDYQNEFDQFRIEMEEQDDFTNCGDLGEDIIRFEPSSKDCNCCKGLVERCDGEICQDLGECYCVVHAKHKDKS